MLVPRSNTWFNNTPNSPMNGNQMQQSVDYLSTMLTQEEKVLIEESIKNPGYRETIRRISDYQRTALRTNITKKTVDEFVNNGIKQFGNTVESFRIHILEYLDRFVELRDANPQKCLMKVLYQCLQCSIHHINPG